MKNVLEKNVINWAFMIYLPTILKIVRNFAFKLHFRSLDTLDQKQNPNIIYLFFSEGIMSRKT